MNLELGDYFTIERGNMVCPPMDAPFERPAQYDDSFKGAVFKLLAQEHTFVACEIVFPHILAGHTISLDMNGVEIMPLSPSYVEALKGGKQFSEPLSPTSPNPLLDMLSGKPPVF